MRNLVIIPCYNEAASIGKLVTRGRPWADICVVDDASTDTTPDILKHYPDIQVITHSQRTHIPGAICDGLRFALKNGYDRIITMDAGFSHSPSDIPRFLDQADKDLIIGVRKRKIGGHFHRRFISWVANRLVNYSLGTTRLDFRGPGLTDCTSGFRLYSPRAAQAILSRPLSARSFAFHLEALAIVFQAGLTLGEIPVTYRFSNSTFNPEAICDGLRIITGLLKRPKEL